MQPVGTDGRGAPPVRIDVPSRTPDAPRPPASPSRAPEAPGRPSPPETPSPPAKPSASPTPARVLWSPGDEGRDIRELQARLRQIAWIFHGPTGTYDDLTAEAVRGFQGRARVCRGPG